MTSANATRDSRGDTLYAGGLDLYNLKPHEDGDTRKVFEERVPVMHTKKLGDLLGSKDYDHIARHVLKENSSLRMTDEVQVGRNYRSPIKFLDVPNGKNYRQNGSLFYEVSK